MPETQPSQRAPQQRSLDTRDALVGAALHEFAQHGFDGASTRVIAARAGVAQSAVPYHFSTKEALWRAAVDRVFGVFRTRLDARLAGLEGIEPYERARLVLIDFVRLMAEHPELHRLMSQEGGGRSERLEWLVETHSLPFMEWFRALLDELGGPPLGSAVRPDHYIYMLIGAVATPYSLGPEFELSTGGSPFSSQMVEAHARSVVALFLPDPGGSEGGAS